MKALMFGWEYPPQIKGGLGTACFGLTGALCNIDNMQITFVLPRLYGNEIECRGMDLIGANDVKVFLHQENRNEPSYQYIGVDPNIEAYTSPEEFWKKTKTQTEEIKYFEVKQNGSLTLNESYGHNLIDEIYKYSIVAKTIAAHTDFDIIHSHDWMTYPSGIEAKSATGKPLVVHVHSTEFDRSGGNINPNVYAIEREGMEAADKVITVSNLTKQIVAKKYFIDPEKIETVHNGVAPLDPKYIFSVSKDPKIKLVTFLGRITIQKGPQFFLKAAKLLSEKMDNVRFIMAGDGDLLPDMIKLAEDLGIASKFVFTGFLCREEVFRVLRMSDVFVMPSYSEPFGITALEAIQCGVPTIVSRQSGVSEVLKRVSKVNHWEIEHLSNLTNNILNHPRLCSHKIKFAQKEVQQLTWDIPAAKIHNIYSKLAV